MPPTTRRPWERWLAAAVVVQLTAGVLGAIHLQPVSRVSNGRQAAVHARAVLDARSVAVRTLLDARSRAVLDKDEAAFLATVDPQATAFLAQQRALIKALHDVPLVSWSYELDAEHVRPPSLELDAKRGTWWSPDVLLHYAIAVYDPTPTAQPQGLTFVERDGRWYLGADDDFAASGHPTTRDMWDGGPVSVTRGTSCLVLSHPGSRASVRALVGECDAAVPHVTAVWGRAWGQHVVLVIPSSSAELSRMVPDAGDLTQIAALATAELVSPELGYHPVGDRVIVNPANFFASDFGPLGRRVVLTHEITHVASRAATGPQVPTWFVEGLADYVGYKGVRLSVAAAAEELAKDIARGRTPQHLPVDGAFNGTRKDLAQSYEMSWLAVVLLSKTYGQAAVLKAYRDAGADPGAGALDRAMRKDLHTTLAAFTRAWKADLKRQLA